MKKVILVLSSVLALSLSVKAQDFYPDWYFTIKGGAGETIGETTFDKLISPAAALNLGYQFTPGLVCVLICPDGRLRELSLAMTMSISSITASSPSTRLSIC